MSKEEAVADLSDELARIHLALAQLGLTWESARVQAWVDRAGRAYRRGYLDRGEVCPMAPPYPTLDWMPPELVRALAQTLWKEVQGGKLGEPARESGGSG